MPLADEMEHTRVSLTDRELWTAIHGMVLGALFLLAFAGGLAGLYGLGRDWLTHAGVRESLRRLVAGTWIMAILAWPLSWRNSSRRELQRSLFPDVG